MALTPQELSILMKSGTVLLFIKDQILCEFAGSQREKKHAAAIYPIRCHGNRLLCTVIIMNVVSFVRFNVNLFFLFKI